MNNNLIGKLGLILGLFLLSLEFYFLNIVQSLKYLAFGSALTNSLDYIFNGSTLISIIITIIIIIYSLFLIQSKN